MGIIFSHGPLMAKSFSCAGVQHVSPSPPPSCLLVAIAPNIDSPCPWKIDSCLRRTPSPLDSSGRLTNSVIQAWDCFALGTPLCSLILLMSSAHASSIPETVWTNKSSRIFYPHSDISSLAIILNSRTTSSRLPNRTHRQPTTPSTPSSGTCSWGISCVIVIDALDKHIDDQPDSATLSVLGCGSTGATDLFWLLASLLRTIHARDRLPMP